jgi:hypothetical protein
MIPKNEMEDGVYYKGTCRNAKIAVWNDVDKLFYHLRWKFGYRMDTIEHFEDVKDKGMDGFIPLEKIEDLDWQVIRQAKIDNGY